MWSDVEVDTEQSGKLAKVSLVEWISPFEMGNLRQHSVVGTVISPLRIVGSMAVKRVVQVVFPFVSVTQCLFIRF